MAVSYFLLTFVLASVIVGVHGQTTAGAEPDPNAYCMSCSERRNNRDLYANPNDCHSYIQCFYFNESTAIGFRRKCHSGMFWNDNLLTCVPEGPLPCDDFCQDEQVAEAGCYADPDPDKCASFFKCSNEISYQFCCPPLTRFDPSTCSCVGDETCSNSCYLPTTPSSTPRPPIINLNYSMCVDEFGNLLRPVLEDPYVFQLVDSNDFNNSKILPCAPGTAFNALTCLCDILVDVPAVPQRQCNLYLPFDGNFKDYSSTHAYVSKIGRVDISYAQKARGLGSLVLYNGWLEVPVFKSLDLGSTASWCFFYKCGYDPTEQMSCSKTGGLLSNNKDKQGSEFSFIIASTPLDQIQVRLGFMYASNSTDEEQPIDKTSNSGFQQVCVVYDGTSITLYIDSVKFSVIEASGELARAHCPLTIGSDQIFGNFTGFIDEVLVCPFALTPGEVAVHFEGGQALENASLIARGKLPSNECPKVYGTAEEEWAKWCEVHSHPCSDQAAFEAFSKTLEEVKEQNALYKKGEVSNSMEMNKFAAMTDEELEKRLGLVLPEAFKWPHHGTLLGSTSSCYSGNLNWVDIGCVGAVQDQGSCAACWAFAAASAIMSQVYINTGNLVELSMQQLIDCSWSYGNQGCSGGLMSYAYSYLAKLLPYGLAVHSIYPYVAKDSNPCSWNQSVTNYGAITTYKNISASECDLVNALITYGPLSCGVLALRSFIYIPPGQIYNMTTCRTLPNSLNHALLLVGIGVDNSTGTGYFLLKNTWGTNWGESGYVRVIRGDPYNQCVCNICKLCSVPVLAP